ncbi:MAG: molybdopterin molybdotransferase MoeA [Polyangiaceae bacterium]|nr:molybdopterin molybdotransferase MoeA [Polyangiaceae bacterium]
MLSFDEAFARILAQARPLSTEQVSLEQALGRTLAEDVLASAPMPAFHYSAMDGYALAVSDCEGKGPFRLRVQGESQTGHATPSFTPRTACRIFTGAALPEGADAVLPQENVRLLDGHIEFDDAPELWRHVRKMGEDLALGAPALRKGQRLTAARLGLLAALDRAQISVGRRPNVVVLCTGDELRPAGSEARPNSIPESNAISLVSLARSVGANTKVAPIVPDKIELAEQAVRDSLANTDLLVTVGGASVGDHDVVKEALVGAGASLDFWKVSLRPGKPLIFGKAGNTLILGLPGNPVSAQVTFTLFGLPLLRALQGEPEPSLDFLTVPLGAPISQQPGRTGFYRAVMEKGRVYPVANQASGAVTSMASANALIMVPAECTGYAEGELVSVLLLVT